MLDRLIEDDGIRGDEYGDFDKNTVTEERARLKREKVTICHRVQPARNCSICAAAQCAAVHNFLAIALGFCCRASVATVSVASRP